ncbi:protein YLS7-like [Aristolochia californica]|uniref:protein YLS7-like n=1 Tax=Aristolochia californica TaxID=171875 RepID=UPI0035DC54DD
MTLGSPKSLSVIFPMSRSISSIVVTVGVLALFLVLASWVLISNPNEHSSKLEVIFLDGNQSRNVFHSDKSLGNEEHDAIIEKRSGRTGGLERVPSPSSVELKAERPPGLSDSPNSSEAWEIDSGPQVNPGNQHNLMKNSPLKPEASDRSDSTDGIGTVEDDKVSLNNSTTVPSNSFLKSSLGSVVNATAPASTPQNQTKKTIVDSVESCDLFHGKWFYDQVGPLYTNNSCPVLTQMQNCQGNGRPDKDYENWRWRPAQCDLPRFDARKFLELMRGKTLAFIGDSVARNQMESLICILWQVEAPKNRGNRRMQRWYFKSTSVSIVRIWSSWLVHQTDEAFQWAPQGVTKLHLDAPDEGFMEFIPRFDVVVLSSGHWFAKQSVYILENEIVGGQLWWPDKTRQKKVNNIEAFGISVETILTAMATHPNYTGLTIVRSFSPDHYEGGAWNTGGSCTGKVQPAGEGELVKNEFTDIMHAKQVMGFENAVGKATNKSKLRLMDITEAFGFRHDGHPGPYRNPDPNKKTQRGPNGEPPPQDCLHWCMPGPVDTWNELVLEIIRREFEGAQ